MNKKKHFLLMLFCILIVIGSVRYMMVKEETDGKETVAVVLPEEWDADSSGVMDGIRDYAMNHEVILNVWYKDRLSSEDLEKLILEEKKHTCGVLLVYPELYTEQTMTQMYEEERVLAVTNRMKEQFAWTAGFEECDEFTYSLPLNAETVKKLTEGPGDFIYVKNTYKLGYLSMKMIMQNAQEGNMENLRLEYLRVDEKNITDGEILSLLTE